MNRGLLVLSFVWWTAPVGAGEITTNGLGGGAWSEPATWKGNQVPGADDIVVVRKFDTVVFDRTAHAGGEVPVSCRQLQIDPRGLLQFKTNAGRIVLAVTGTIENFGTIKLDGTRSAQDFLELRLAGTDAASRVLKVGRGAGLLLYGKAGLERPNVALTANVPAGEKEPGLVDVESQAAIDWQRIRVADVRLVARKIDNTGARANERLNLKDSLFEGHSTVRCQGCDTPVVARNTFDASQPLAEPAIDLADSPLSEVQGNTVRGPFAAGIGLSQQTDSTVLDNSLAGCLVGLRGNALTNTMIKQVAIEGCATGLKLDGVGGVVERVTIAGATAAIQTQNSTLQLTQIRVREPVGTEPLLSHVGGVVAVLDANLPPERIAVKPSATSPMTAVTAWQFLVAAAPDAPAGSLLEVRTADPPLPAGAADPNVRHAPAPLVNNVTPRPDQLNALTVKSWTLDAKGSLVPAPAYELRLLGPAAEGTPRPVLKQQSFRPAPEAHRGSGRNGAWDHDAPTVELHVRGAAM